MNKMMRSVVALLLVFGCTNNVVFAVEAEDRTIPESLIGVDVEAADLIERVEVTSENCIKLRDENDISEAKKVITLSDMAYMVLDDSKNVIDDSLIWLRATTSVYWSVDANVLKKADIVFTMEADECVTITVSAAASGDGKGNTTSEAPVQETAYNAYMQLTEDFLMTYDGSNSVTVYPDYYGGSYTSDDGKLVICIPEDATPAETAALSKLDDDSYVIETVDYSYNTLKEVMGQLNDYFLNEDNDISNNINRFGIYDNQNRIVVSLFDASPEKIAEFKETVCDSSAIIFEEKENIINTEVSVNPGNEIQNGNTRRTLGIINGSDGEYSYYSKATEVNSALGTSRY